MQKEQSVVEDRKEAVKDKLKKDMSDLQNDVVNIDERIKQIEAKIKNPEKLRMTVEKFSNSLNSLINRLEKGDLVEKDILIRNMVSNLEIDAQKGWFTDINHPLISSSGLSFPQVDLLVTRAGVEPTTFSLGRSCSIQLSYRAKSAFA